MNKNTKLLTKIFNVDLFRQCSIDVSLSLCASFIEIVFLEDKDAEEI